jgi:putative phosphoesterase
MRRGASTDSHRYRVGLISDTHGLLRPEALAALAGSDFIIHGGDIGDPEIIRRLAAIAPVTVVRGNNDRDAWAASLRDTEILQVGAVSIYVIHDLAEMTVDATAAGFRVVISGHSHRPRAESREGVLYVNPGSAGPRRFSLPIAIGELTIAGNEVSHRLMELSDQASRRAAPSEACIPLGGRRTK